MLYVRSRFVPPSHFPLEEPMRKPLVLAEAAFEFTRRVVQA